MTIEVGRIVDGKLVLDSGDSLAEGTRVRVWIGDTTPSVMVSDEELALIDEGRDDSSRGKLIDARAFVRELNRVG
ncbi:MAG: hypothetical protein CMN30_33595 [Sandaracinus sp.]|nr:hypothetical protein [Sandaracinus sp.]|tara:strand:+ start:5588 stop:5812 length:225 start_codon:yes stop_codon:yes gene_type:complete